MNSNKRPQKYIEEVVSIYGDIDVSLLFVQMPPCPPLLLLWSSHTFVPSYSSSYIFLGVEFIIVYVVSWLVKTLDSINKRVNYYFDPKQLFVLIWILKIQSQLKRSLYLQ